MVEREKRAYGGKERDGEMDRRRTAILDRAEEIFISRGLAESSMTDIAREAGLSRRTLYRYYPTKEELAFEIEFRIFRDFQSDVGRMLPLLKGTGFEKLQQLFRHLDRYIAENEKKIRFTGEFDHYFSGEYPSETLEAEFVRIVGAGDDPLELLLKEGKRDGSVRADIDAQLVSRTLSNSLLGMAQRVTLRGGHLAREQGMDPSLMLSQLFSLYLEAVRKK
ncbi:MAG: hypothetical protein CVV44_16820 [Spirochaetae bacterium HGW-Spirochaetae-1]|nr:MAG: hypothetical protein CVV44_16820 [Spirochaetae bacterium HGW-Spirochaetae-1]